jgi:hypothetical protein
LSTTSSKAIYNAVYNGIIYKGLTPALANKNATKAVEQYKSGEYDTLDLLIQSMIEEAGK